MSEFLPRTGPAAPVVSATERGPFARVVPVLKAARTHTEAGAASQTTLSDRSTAAADYAKIQADIADVLARIEPPVADPVETAGAAERAIVALIPNPVVVLPLPPTDPQIMAFVAQVAQSVAERTVQARAAQANATPILIEAAAS